MTEAAERFLEPDPLVPRVGRVLRRRRDAPDVWTLDIEPVDGPAFAAAPGQFNMLTAFGVGEAAISVSGDPSGKRLVHSIRAVGPVSKALARLGEGAAIGVRGPFGVGWPMAEAGGRDVVLVAGGLGLAPLRPALYALLAERARYGRIVLLFGARSPEDIVFRRELEKWRARLDIEVSATVDHAMSEWRGHVGVVTTLIPRANLDPARTLALICGPELMMRHVAASLGDAGIADESIYVSLERNMKCAVGHCGHCQFGPLFVCRDGPVFRYDRVRNLVMLKEI
jgi:NAD(P)H-flavin reductase